MIRPVVKATFGETYVQQGRFSADKIMTIVGYSSLKVKDAIKMSP